MFSKRNDIGDAFLPDTSVPLRGLGNWSIIFSSLSEPLETRVRPYVYEIILLLWRETWLEAKSGKNEHRQRFEAFTENYDFLLPLCLKSLILRCSEISNSHNLIPSLLFDHSHITLLGSLIEATAHGLMESILKGNCQRDFDHALVKGLSSNDLMIDFLTGLFTAIHPAQVSWLTIRYFDFLRSFDTTSDECVNIKSFKSVIRTRGSRLLRLRAAEKLSSLPRFIALNFPLKTSNIKSQMQAPIFSWTRQMKMMSKGLDASASGTYDFIEGVQRLPESCWLAKLLVDECFSVCASSFELALSCDSAVVSQTTNKSESDSLLHQALTCHQSLALHSITIIYELLLRSHATDHRYQSEEASCRIADVFLLSITKNTIDKIPVLDKMAVDDKIRVIWLSCVLYVLQESSETTLCALIEVGFYAFKLFTL